MKTKNMLPILLLAPSLLMNSMAFSQEPVKNYLRSPQSDSRSLKLEKISNGVTDQIKTARLKSTVNFLNVQKNGLGLSLDYQMKSEPSIGDRYSAVDTWQLNLSLIPNTFSDRSFAPGFDALRDVTIIRQMEKRSDSIVRLPYDPFTKLPYNSERALQLDQGDFVAYRAPMTVFLGKSLIPKLAKKASTDTHLTAFATNEFDIHVFRMAGKHVRVRLTALREKGVSASATAGVVSFNTKLLTKILDIHPLEFFGSASDSELFSVDYVFNLETEEARNAYDRLLSNKYKMSNIQLAKVNPFASEGKLKDLLYSDLESVQALADADLQRGAEDRRVVRLSMGENESDSLGFGFRTNIKILKLKVATKKTDSKVTLYSMNNEKKNYLFNLSTREISGEAFWLWGGENRIDSGLLMSADDSHNPTGLIGLHSRRSTKEINLSRDEYEGFKKKLNRTLPVEITSQIQWPTWPSDRSDVKNARVEQDLFFNASSLESLSTVGENGIRTQLIELINNWGKFSSRPMAEKDDVYGGRNHYVDAFQSRNYMEAYGSHEVIEIPRLLAMVFNSQLSMTDRMVAYERLNNIELYNEIAPTLVMRLIPKDKLKDAISFRLKMTAKSIAGTEMYYPSMNHQQNMNVFLSVVANSNYISDRTFNLGQYLDERGNAYGLKEVISRTK